MGEFGEDVFAEVSEVLLAAPPPLVLEQADKIIKQKTRKNEAILRLNNFMSFSPLEGIFLLPHKVTAYIIFDQMITTSYKM
ncbi:hypothetical protein SD70_01040 [Gordoniibacillus kamchatkensis]|uniref:Uncharacterized protein n=1 Tax=Gordoniibacillus kamchatkensis TaxID=1590651 RepID=A0ABR5ANB5_9BACL|nr:hypothetical protein SD70_01040 [Paenibacillus sp. VKM B-2647]